MKILKEPILKKELLKISENVFDGKMVKAVVDVKNGLIGIDGELQSDIQCRLLLNGSRQEDLWGTNLYPEMDDEDFIEFDSMINARPRQNNRSRYVEDEKARQKIIEIVKKWIR